MCWRSAVNEKKNTVRFSTCKKIIELFWKVVDKDAVYGRNKKDETDARFDEKAAQSYFNTMLKRPNEVKLPKPKKSDNKEEDPKVQNDNENSNQQEPKDDPLNGKKRPLDDDPKSDDDPPIKKPSVSNVDENMNAHIGDEKMHADENMHAVTDAYDMNSKIASA